MLAIRLALILFGVIYVLRAISVREARPPITASPEVTGAERQDTDPTPPGQSPQRKEVLKVLNSRWKREYGYSTFEGDVENVGTRTIKSFNVLIVLRDKNGKEIDRKYHPIVFLSREGMRPGHIRPFSVMWKELSHDDWEMAYALLVEEYE